MNQIGHARYDRIGRGYDSTRKPDSFLLRKMYEFLSSDTANGKFLDVGCGTGNYTHELKVLGLDFTGIDPSEEMLEKARLKNNSIKWLQGTAEKIDLESNFFDGVLASLTIHHWSDLNAGFHQIGRVLKPGGKLVLFTTLPSQNKSYWLNHYFPIMMKDSMKILPTIATIENAFDAGGIDIIDKDPYFIQPDLEDHFLYCGKHNPELYFDENIRKGISSFSLIAHQDEINTGLKKLRQDIDTGDIKEVISPYENDKGDYLFIIGKKN